MKKEQLREYRRICGEIDQLKHEREEWMAKAERSTTAPSQTPRLSEHDPLPRIIDRISNIREKTNELLLRLCDSKERIDRAIARLPPLERQVIRARYINGKCWDAISLETNYSVPQLHRIHNKGLEGLKFIHAKGRRNIKKH